MAYIYLAARYSRQTEMQEVALELEKLGHTVTSRWVRGDHLCNDEELLYNEQHARQIALEDLMDLEDADWFILFTDPIRTATRGGKQVEAGIAIASGHQLIRVGLPENVFQQLKRWTVYPSTVALLDHLRGC